jgi:hypothetical protein
MHHPHIALARWSTAVTLVALGLAACAAPPANISQSNKSANGNDDESVPPPSQTSAPPPASQPVVTTPAASMTLTSINPPSVGIGSAPPSGLTLTLTGTGFASGDQVAIGTVMVAATVTSATTITAVVPAASLATAATLPVAVVSAAQVRSNTVSLAVLAAASALTSLSPTSAPISTTASGSLVLTVTGTGFDSTSTIVFNGSDVQTALMSPTTLRGNVPNGLLMNAATINVIVRRASAVSSPLPFTIGGASSSCQQTCAQLGLSVGECSASGGGIDFGGLPFPFDIGGLFGGGGGQVQCGADGCVTEGCNN